MTEEEKLKRQIEVLEGERLKLQEVINAVCEKESRLAKEWIKIRNRKNKTYYTEQESAEETSVYRATGEDTRELIGVIYTKENDFIRLSSIDSYPENFRHFLNIDEAMSALIRIYQLKKIDPNWVYKGKERQ